LRSANATVVTAEARRARGLAARWLLTIAMVVTVEPRAIAVVDAFRALRCHVVADIANVGLATIASEGH
jgi:hypothetical protein